MRRRSGDFGFVTLQYVIAVAWSLVLLVLVANFLVDLYARGAVRDALDDGVRAAAPSWQPVAACEGRAQEVSRLARALGHDVRPCEVDGTTMVADGTLPSWLPFVVPPWRLSLTATSKS